MFSSTTPNANSITIAGRTVYDANTMASNNEMPIAFTLLTYISSLLMLMICTGSFMLS
jgi:hypothetical protein